MASASFTIDGPVDVAVVVNDDGGTLNFTVTVLETNGVIGDLRGFFFDVDGDFAGTIDVVGDDVTDFDSDDVSNLGNGANITPASFDVGVEIGTQGIGADDIRTTSFSVGSDAGPLTLEDIIGQSFGVRLTSVGEEGGDRGGSLKIVDDPEIVPDGPEEECFFFCVGFDGFDAGDTVGRIAGSGGLAIRVNGDRAGADSTPNDAMIFDADQMPPASGGDDDLLGGDGNVLIISEDNDPIDPDDAAAGGRFVFRFSEAVDLQSLTAIDTEEGGRIVAFGAGGARLGSLDLTETADRELKTYDLSRFDGVLKLVVRLGGSGAIDDLCFEYCAPQPCECEV